MKLNLNNIYKVLTSNWDEKEISLKEILWKDKTILYFYPKDNTPGCSIGNKDFSDLRNDFLEKWYKLVWVSKDSIESHKKFSLENDLISDPDLILHKELWVFGKKNNYWKIILWVIRGSFLLDKDWNIIKEYRNIKAKWHAQKILKEV